MNNISRCIDARIRDALQEFIDLDGAVRVYANISRQSAEPSGVWNTACAVNNEVGFNDPLAVAIVRMDSKTVRRVRILDLRYFGVQANLNSQVPGVRQQPFDKRSVEAS